MIKRIKCFFIIMLFVIVNVNSKAYAFANEGEIKDNEIFAKSAILIDAASKRVLYEKNGFEKMPMASTTKILTCLVALENGDKNQVVEFSKYAASMPKVKLGAAAGEKYYLGDLLYSLMLESHNDTAVAIAENIAGSVEKFAEMMNEKAKEIGATDSNFVTPNGLDDDNHYTTAYDLAIIAAEAIKNDEFLKITNMPSYTFSSIDGKHTYSLNNKNLFLQMMEGAIGVKTGFTGNAGYCFVGAVKRDNRTFISVVLASSWPPAKSNKWKDTVKIMKYGINNYEYRNIFSSRDYKKVEVYEGKKKLIYTEIRGDCSILMSNNDRVRYEYILPSELRAPIKEGEAVGELNIYINEKLFKCFEICAKNEVKKIDYKYSFMLVLNRFLI